MNAIYTDGRYLKSTASWHVEDSPWKSEQILQMLCRHNIVPLRIAEIGCGAGGILENLAKCEYLAKSTFFGFDISPQAIDLAMAKSNERLHFSCSDLLAQSEMTKVDLLLVMDVFEHVPDYLGFLEKCKPIGEKKLFHIPLDVHVSSAIRGTVSSCRYNLGHLHYFTAETAIETLRDSGYRIVDFTYTSGALSLFKHHRSWRRSVMNIPRSVLSLFSKSLSARFFGGFSLLVLAE